jgi:OmpA-OmpF porin, OOP family
MGFAKHLRAATLGVLPVLVFFTAGCATKKWVQTSVVEPMETKMGKVDKKVDQNKQETDARVNEVDQNAERGIANAQSSADKANQGAADASKAAQEANQLAQKGVDQASAVDQKVENSDNYQPVKTEKVLFKFNHADLTTEDKQALDSLAQNLGSMKHYVVEVQGFTDRTGSKQYNLELSERRADAVVRYLTAEKNIPLVKIHRMGYGIEKPAAPNNTRDGRKENRRVEVRILAPQGANPGSSQSAAAPTNPGN